MMNSEQFKDAFRKLASGVSVVSFWAGADMHGFAATSLTSVSMNPPTALFCIGRQSRSFSHLKLGKVVGISILGAHQKSLSKRFSSGLPRGSFDDIDIVSGSNGAPMIGGALATLEGLLIQQHPVGDNVICVCSLLSAHTRPDGHPLIYASREYRELGAVAKDTEIPVKQPSEEG
ncbi:MAG TPA: flavin reductase family protein [Paraburkholderia sp.]|jgi:flavin reductase (DIM6/NTAB) family NADH-FMN oxidoreductase RutF|nr:flavin reductase family protein [Paraburkholderia sp.]